jgi:predicted phosphate transport protein (TIGR00153 family)
MVLRNERQVILLMEKYLHEVNRWFQSSSERIGRLIGGGQGDAEPLEAELKEIGRNAESFRNLIWDMLYKGVYLPRIREDIYLILRNIDKAAHAAESCCAAFLSQHPQVPEELKDLYVLLSEECFQIIEPVSESVLKYLKGDDVIPGIREKCDRIRGMRAAVDDEALALKHRIFSDGTNPWRQFQLNAFIDCIVEVSDRLEDVGEDMQRITMKLVA